MLPVRTEELSAVKGSRTLRRQVARLCAGRPAVLCAALLGVLLLLLLALAWPVERDLAPPQAVVRWLGLTDLCLTTESPAGRSPAMADPGLPLQLVAGGLDIFAAPPLFDTAASPAPPLAGRIAAVPSPARRTP